MSKDPEDLELEALQRRLDDAFASTRPRRGFEDDLWQRMQSGRRFDSKLRHWMGSLGGGLRQMPAIPIAAGAALLVVIVGVAIAGPSVALFGGNHSSQATSGAAVGPNTHDLFAGGKVPTPALRPGGVDTGIPAPASAGQPEGQASQAAANLYFGPANLTWAGTMPAPLPYAPVYVYAEPTGQQRAAIAQGGALDGVTLQTRGSVPQLPLEPTFVLTELHAGVAPGTDPVAAAESFLQQHNAAPNWLSIPAVQQSGPITRVVFQRLFAMPDRNAVYLVDWNGDQYGTEVDISAGQRTARGPLPLTLQTINLPAISNDEAARLAISQSPASTQSITPIPTVKLDHVEVVYALAISGNHGFYEPAYLFSGTFSYNGQTYTKRVLVPLVPASLRS